VVAAKRGRHDSRLKGGDLQDGMLAHYLEQAAHADSHIEKRINEEPFDFRDMTCGVKKQKDHK
jgi:hypothetical protein